MGKEMNVNLGDSFGPEQVEAGTKVVFPGGVSIEVTAPCVMQWSLGVDGQLLVAQDGRYTMCGYVDDKGFHQPSPPEEFRIALRKAGEHARTAAESKPGSLMFAGTPPPPGRYRLDGTSR